MRCDYFKFGPTEGQESCGSCIRWMPFRERCSWQHPEWVIRKEAVIIAEAEALYDISGTFIGKYIIQRGKGRAIVSIQGANVYCAPGSFDRLHSASPPKRA